MDDTSPQGEESIALREGLPLWEHSTGTWNSGISCSNNPKLITGPLSQVCPLETGAVLLVYRSLGPLVCVRVCVHVCTECGCAGWAVHEHDYEALWGLRWSQVWEGLGEAGVNSPYCHIIMWNSEDFKNSKVRPGLPGHVEAIFVKVGD